LLISRNLPPLIGGMERLNLHVAQCLDKHAALSVIGPQGSAAYLPETVRVTEQPVKPLWRFIFGALIAALRLGASKKFAFTFAGSGLTVPMAWLAARLSGGKTIAYLHGLDIIVDNAVYQRLWSPFLRRCDQVIVNSRNTARLAAEKGIAQERITIINPGADIPAFDPRQGEAFRSRFGLADRPLLLSVGRMTPRKGLVDFARYALPEIAGKYPEVCLLIVGDAAPDALTGSGAAESARFDHTIAELGLAKNVMKLGVCDDETLSAAYFASTLHVFPVIEKQGDVEGFGMVALEAAAHGLPTVAFDIGGIGDAVDEGKSGFLVPPKNYGMLAERVCALLTGNVPEMTPEACRTFARGKSWEVFEQRLMACIASAARQ